MKLFARLAALIAITFLLSHHSFSQNAGRKGPDQQPEGAEQKPERKIWIKLKSGETLTGVLQKVDLESVDFTVKNILQTVSLDEVISISFVGSTPASRSGTTTKSIGDSLAMSRSMPAPKSIVEPSIYPMTASLKPTILYREKARYTEEARSTGTQGTVVLQMVFQANGNVAGIKVIQGLPHGLTENAIAAAKKIKFEPAMKDGKPVSVRGNLEFTFNP